MIDISVTELKQLPFRVVHMVVLRDELIVLSDKYKLYRVTIGPRL